ncbi:hypothetical protein FKG94_05835 [Exilibacterium tricleocarpae]|uniref:Flagellar hook-length control protein-like C-terminal domain-containing protein n=2 Tax=Exilibacterium tricleocarpae TaxID=2591008 RepID=A0A545U4C7_9GAMM|nr:hypothetical protein FKG94_05835 [Exilibacterium tricleocarpae]
MRPGSATGTGLPQTGNVLPPGATAGGDSDAEGEHRQASGAAPPAALQPGRRSPLAGAAIADGGTATAVPNSAQMSTHTSTPVSTQSPGQLSNADVAQPPAAVKPGQEVTPILSGAGGEAADTIDTDSLQSSREPALAAVAKPVQQPALQQYQATAARAGLVQTGVDTPVADPQWRGVVQERVLWLAAQNISAAEIHLDPPELGPLQVRITLSQDQAQVTFSSQHASVREALDTGSHRLRELFEGEGLNLVDVDVSDQSFERQSDPGSGDEVDTATAGSAEAEADTAAVSAINTALGLVDHYV